MTLVATTERWLLPHSARSRPPGKKNFSCTLWSLGFVGFSSNLDLGSGRLAHALTGAEGQATKASSHHSHDLEECAPRIFLGDIFLPPKNCPAGPSKRGSGLHWWRWPAFTAECGTHRIEFLFHPRLNLITARPLPSDDVSLPATPKDAGGDEMPLPAFQRGRLVIGVSPSQAEQRSLVDLLVAL